MRVLAIALATILSACATTPTPTTALTADYSYSYWNGLAEPLWDQAATTGTTRLLMARPHFRRDAYAMIRIDRTRQGATGALVRADPNGANRWTIHEQRRFTITSAELAELDALIAASRLWRSYPEFWILTDPETLCIHGVELVLERANADGYRFSAANAQCTAPSDYKAVAAYMITLADEPDLANWLR